MTQRLFGALIQDSGLNDKCGSNIFFFFLFFAINASQLSNGESNLMK